MSSDIVFRTESLSKTYPKSRTPANDRIDLEVRRGETLALLGANGAGKTTLVKLLMNILRPSSGAVYLESHNLADNPNLVPRHVSYMPQKPYAFLHVTAREAIYYTGRLRGLGQARARAESDRLMEEWGLRDVEKRSVWRLSGGQQRLVGMGIALIGDMPIFVLDEPTNDLDPLFRRQAWQRIRKQNKERGATIILVTHNLREAEEVADRVAILRDGKLVAVGTSAELKSRLDRQVRLHLTLSKPLNGQCRESLEQWGEVAEATDRSYLLLLEPEGLAQRVQGILAGFPMNEIEELHIQSASLEDLFLKVGGHDVSQLNS